jgi:hypothetical protein
VIIRQPLKQGEIGMEEEANAVTVTTPNQTLLYPNINRDFAFSFKVRW